ncbi:EAL domain-containing protein [Idiomarina piscisalsi]|uniref:EAL domain-containing protein n=1 Tax=Idiomarina piscisalsi TaxID=1096243 RepID=UPI0013831148|nr:EAL domain-containing protein [Idiomarina piscisalsi]MTJ00887.1 EAL domain-containing protein [Idiomarina piscisalsi]
MSGSNIIELRQSVNRLDALNDNITLVTAAGQLVGTLQRERGLSVLITDTGTERLRSRLVQSRERTNQQLINLKQKLGSVDITSETKALHQGLKLATDALGQLPVMRERVDNEQATPDEILQFYTAIIRQTNSQLNELARDLSIVSLSREVNAYFILNRLRELLGQERVIVGKGLLNGKMSHEDIRQLAYNAGRQRSLLIGFESQTTVEPGGELSALTTEFRQKLLATRTPNELLQGMDADVWIAKQTQLIATVQDVEQRLITSIKETATSSYESSLNELWRYVIISPLVLLTALFLSWLILRYVRRQIMLADSVFQYTQDRITITDADGRILDVNPAFTRITGYKKREVLGKNPRFLKSGRQGKSFYRSMFQQLIKDGFWQGELWNRRKNGEFYAELASMSAIKNKRGEVQNFVGISSDVTERAFAHKEELEFRTYHDALTGLPNILLVRDRLEHALSLAGRKGDMVVVVSIDVDSFKNINAQFGHAVGDKVIEQLARRLNATIRDGDTVGRLSGDEFLLVIEGGESELQVNEVLERIKSELSETITVGSYTMDITVSMGVTAYPQDNNDADTLIRHSSQSLHQAKRNGRDRITWFDTHREQEQAKLTELIKRMELAINNDELELFYQPKVNMETCEVIGVEALLRWRDPERGLVPPGDFLPFIEEHPFSITIGNWVLNEALKQVSEWRSQGVELPVSVNINALQLLDNQFLDSVSTHLSHYTNVSPKYLEIEVLESAAIGEIHKAADVLAKCKKMGIPVSLDDFGTGYAALDYLKRLPAQTLKIDQSFVRDMLTDEGDLAIVKGIIGLAKAFRFEVIAEGVETESQGKNLLELGCRYAQGYGIGRPMPAGEVLPWLSVWKFPEGWSGYESS